MRGEDAPATVEDGLRLVWDNDGHKLRAKDPRADMVLLAEIESTDVTD